MKNANTNAEKIKQRVRDTDPFPYVAEVQAGKFCRFLAPFAPGIAGVVDNLFPVLFHKLGFWADIREADAARRLARSLLISNSLGYNKLHASRKENAQGEPLLSKSDLARIAEWPSAPLNTKSARAYAQWVYDKRPEVIKARKNKTKIPHKGKQWKESIKFFQSVKESHERLESAFSFKQSLEFGASWPYTSILLHRSSTELILDGLWPIAPIPSELPIVLASANQANAGIVYSPAKTLLGTSNRFLTIAPIMAAAKKIYLQARQQSRSLQLCLVPFFPWCVGFAGSIRAGQIRGVRDQHRQKALAFLIENEIFREANKWVYIILAPFSTRALHTLRLLFSQEWNLKRGRKSKTNKSIDRS